MKLAKLSLAAIVVAGLASSSFAADNLADAFKEGKVNGELRAYYFNKDNGKSSEDLFTTGVILGYKTASLYGLSAGFTFQGNSSPFASEADKAMFNGDEYGTGAVLSESYLAYTIGKTTVQVGRMFIDTPLVSSSGSRMTKEAFEGATIVNTDLSNTTLIAGYVQKFQSRTNGNGKVGDFTKSVAFGSDGGAVIDNGAYTFAVINKSVPGLTLTGAYAYADSYVKTSATAIPANTVLIDGGVHIGYVEALYEGKAGEIGYTLGAQDYYNSMETVANGYDDSINVYGLKAGLSFKGIHGTVAFSQVTNKNIPGGVVVSGLGNGADLLYTDSVISNPGYTPDTKTYMVDLNYDLTAAANVGARYTYADGKNESYKNEKDAYTSVYGYYKFDSVLKGLKLGAEYEDKSKDISGDTLWVKANYKF